MKRTENTEERQSYNHWTQRRHGGINYPLMQFSRWHGGYRYCLYGFRLGDSDCGYTAPSINLLTWSEGDWEIGPSGI